MSTVTNCVLCWLMMVFRSDPILAVTSFPDLFQLEKNPVSSAHISNETMSDSCIKIHNGPEGITCLCGNPECSGFTSAFEMNADALSNFLGRKKSLHHDIMSNAISNAKLT